MAFIASAIIGGVTAIGGGLIASHGASSAANTQAKASDYAALLQKQAADAALAEQQRQFNVTQQNLAPWLQAGTSGIYNLANLSGLNLPSSMNPAVPISTVSGTQPLNTGLTMGEKGVPSEDFIAGRVEMPSDQTALSALTGTAQPTTGLLGNPADYINPALGEKGSLTAPWTEQFTPPTDVTEQNDPGFQFRLNEGQKALERSAAARGNLLTGGTAKALTRYGQDYASNEYNNVYNRAFNEYANRYNIFKQNQADQFNRLAAISGVGQTTAGQLGQLGQNQANNVSNILMGSAQNIGNSAQNAAAARASGYVGSANAITGALSGVGNNISDALLLSSLLKAPRTGGTLNVPTWLGTLGGG